MPLPDFEFKEEEEEDLGLLSFRETIQKVNQLNFKDVNFGAIRPGAGSVIEGSLIVKGSVEPEKLTGLGDLAFEDAVEKAKLGTTVIDGGYIVTGMINASRIDTGTLSADRLSVSELNALEIKAGSVDAEDITGTTITGKTIVGSTLTTASSGSRVEVGTGVNQRVDFYIGSSFIGGIQSDNVSASNFVTVFGGTNNHLNLNSGVYAEDATLRGNSTVGIRAGSEVRSFADFVPGSNASYYLGTSSRRWDRAYFDSRLYMYGTTSSRSFIIPNVANGSNLGSPSLYFYQLYADNVRYKNLASFDHIDDLEAIKAVGIKTIEKEGPDDIDSDGNVVKGKKHKKDVWDIKTLPKDVVEGDFIDANAMSGLMIGSLKELINKVETLESQLQELKNKV